jgi:hypothetical protein
MLPDPDPIEKPAQSDESLAGPYRLAGEWWKGAVARDYYFREARGGRLEWIYYDRLSRRWLLQGFVD